MTIQNDFLPIAVASNANVISQADFAALTEVLQGGFSSGIAKSSQINKVLRQSSIMTAVLAAFIVDKSGQAAVDDGTTATLEANLVAAVRSAAAVIAQAGGTADALTATFAPAFTAATLASGCPTVTVRAASANATTTPTFTPNAGVIPPATIVKGNGLPLAVGDIAGAGHWITLQWDATLAKWVLLNPATGVSAQSPIAQIQSVSASVAANALTVGLNPTTLLFRNATLANGTPSSVLVSSALSLVVPSGATLGTTSGNQSRLILVALNSGGTVSLGIVNITNGSINLDETGVVSTTAISTSSNSAGTIYSAAALTGVPYRVVGEVVVTEATAGAWATNPTSVIGAGGLALASLGAPGPAQTWQNMTASRALSTTYYNTTGREIDIFVNASNSYSGGWWLAVSINGASMGGLAGEYNSGQSSGVSISIPDGASYSFASNNGTASLSAWWEKR